MLSGSLASASPLGFSAQINSVPLFRPLAKTTPAKSAGRRPLDLLRAIWSPRNPMGLDKHERSLLAVLVLRADNDTGEIGPLALAELIAATGLGRSSVSARIAELERRGFVARLRRRTSDGDNLPSVYALALGALFEAIGRPLDVGVVHGADDPRPSTGRSGSLPSDLPREERAAPPAPDHTQDIALAGGEAPPGTAIILDALRNPELTPIASPAFAADLARDELGPQRPAELAAQGLREMAIAARDDARAGAPWSASRMRQAARKWIRGARPRGDGGARCADPRASWAARLPVDRGPTEQPAPARIHAQGGAALLSSLRTIGAVVSRAGATEANVSRETTVATSVNDDTHLAPRSYDGSPWWAKETSRKSNGGPS
jgi:hypothetical protein